MSHTTRSTALTETANPDSGHDAAPAPETARTRRAWAPWTWSRRNLIILISLLAAGVILVAALLVWYLITHKPIGALPLLSQDAVPHYSYSIYGPAAPLGIAVSPDGSRIYVTESAGSKRVLVYDRDGHQTGTLGLPASTGTAHTPLYLAINPTNQHVFFTDRITAAIYEFDATNKYLRTFSPQNLGTRFLPLGIAFDAAGNLYATEALSVTSRVLKFDPATGRLLATISSPGPMSFPNGIAVDAHGDVMVTDSNNGRALLFNSAGHLQAQITSGMAPADLGLPRGITVDSQGHIDIVDATNQAVRIYKLSGTSISFVGSIGDQGIGDGLFEYPNGAASDQRAQLYVTDRGNNRVEVWSY